MTSTNSTNRPRRSVLFLSALALQGLTDAMKSGADVVCIDLEDAVPPTRKEEGRAAIQATLPTLSREGNTELAVRINSLRSLDGVADLLACLRLPRTALGAIVLPKVQTNDEVNWAGTLIDEASLHLSLYAIIETNEGLANCLQIAKGHPRLKALFFGGFDLSAALGSTMAWEPLLYARSRVVHAAASAGIDVLDSPFPELNNLEGLRVSSEQARALGMTGKAAKDICQVRTITGVFTPSSREVERARTILEKFDADPTMPLIYEGKLVELPTIKRLRRIKGIHSGFQRGNE
jgi:citrate lyase beta subunit